MYAAAVPATTAAAEFHWKDNPEAGQLDLWLGDQPVVRYMYAFDTSTPQRAHETYKVYHHVFGPGSQTLITKGPGGLYTHHRGMFVGWSRVKAPGGGFDFWHCKNGAHLRHAKVLRQEADADHALLSTEIHWNDKDGKPVLIEQRTLSVRPATGVNGWQFDWRSTLSSSGGEIVLDGDRQHAGFQFRAAQAVAEANGARYVRPAGFPDTPAAVQVNDRTDPNKHVDLGWLAMTFELSGKRYTVEYMEAPGMPRPSRYSERPYGRFGAFFRATVTPDKPLKMRYRLVVSQGDTPSRTQIQQRYDAFLSDVAGGRRVWP